MKKWILMLLVALMVIAPITACAEVALTIETWRPDDTDQWNQILAAYKEVAPGVNLTYEGITSKDYNATLRTQLDAGKGPDIIMARSYATGQDLFEQGYLGDCSDIAGVKEFFAASATEPWTAKTGELFAVPVAAVSHGVYYNKEVFAELGLEVPQTFEAFLALCQKLKDAGYVPLGNGVADEWDILECFFFGMLPNYVGGAEERAKYEAGEKKFTDADFVAALADIQKVAPFLPESYTSVTNTDSNTLFAIAKCAMYVDGSWSSGPMDDPDTGAAFDWGIFAIPAPEGRQTRICFHPDFAMTYNTKTANPDEAKAFLSWLVSKEASSVVANLLPGGFYPMVNYEVPLENPHAHEFLALPQGKELDARFVWPKMMDLYVPMNQEVIKLLAGTATPEDSAATIQAAYDAMMAK